jgi:hypothetical protein
VLAETIYRHLEHKNMKQIEIEKLSIADLKVTWDFVKEDLIILEATAKEKNVSAENIPAY